MKQIVLVTAAVVICSIFCNACSKQAGSSQPLESKWMVTEMPGFTKEELMKVNAHIDLRNPENSTGSLDCNHLFWKTTTKNNGTIAFSQVNYTYKYCEGQMAMESKFVEIAPSITSYKLEGHFLYLYDKQGKQLIKAINPAWD
ncbi:META domain-containing protein [Haoranjiania flava]|uniref:META domain-containing protein n=1 Tax=Haoranjiania flava TaxID=1856322 RepID=A0AAE3LJE2_9BACT|nr:META domain-containing protein [Haoranjiania flava]MCU7693642.1 META domain-containing protein [Haoranjiania flava]